jgi:hypothetical protein
MFDRGFFSYDLFTAARDTGADLLFRVTSTLKLPVLKRLPDDSTCPRSPATASARQRRWAKRSGGPRKDKRSSSGWWTTRSPTATPPRPTG